MLHVAPVRSNLFAGKERLDANLKLRFKYLPPGQHRSIKGRMPSSLETARASSSKVMGLGTVPLCVALS